MQKQVTYIAGNIQQRHLNIPKFFMFILALGLTVMNDIYVFFQPAAQKVDRSELTQLQA